MKDKKPLTHAEREKRYRAAMRERGYTLCRVWVPPERRAELQALAESWRESMDSKQDKGSDQRPEKV